MGLQSADSRRLPRGHAAVDPAESFAALVQRARLRLLRMHYEAGVGHIGGNLSALDALLCLHHRVMERDDLFILSKGHAAGALYVTLWTRGELADHSLEEFHGEGTKVSGHPAPGWLPGIPMATGSLGHGLPVAAGIALARRLRGRPGHVYCLTSDGEWQEGSSWESLIFLSHHRITNLTLLIDANGLQGFGSTRDVASTDRLADRLEAFGVEVREADGHDPEAIISALESRGSRPRAVLLHTVKGKGISFMENRLEWHYKPLTEELYRRAVQEFGSR